MASGAIQRFLWRLISLLLLRRPRPNLGVFTLPTEIILMIATHLSNPSKLSLALTCRTLYSICFPQPLLLNKTEKEELLQLLEKDTPKLYFCHLCTNLHSWRIHWDGNIDNGTPCRQRPFGYLLPMPLAGYIPYHHARLIMNRHFYGLAHGIPTRKISRKSALMLRHRGEVQDYDTECARIVDDMLLILSVKTMFHPHGNAKALRRYIDILSYNVCNHLRIRACRDIVRMQIPELVRGATSPDYFACCKQSFGSCPFCPTDYCIDISWRSRKKGYLIKVSTYRQVGACRSPFDWSWQSMTRFYKTDEPRTAYPIEYRPGVIRDRWNKGEGIETKTESKWVAEDDRRSSTEVL